MQITILSTGVCRDANILELENTYHKRMLQGWPVNIREIKDNLNAEMEAQHQMSAWQPVANPKVLVALDEKGQQFTSEAFAKQLQDMGNRGVRTIGFLIGGPDGLSDRVRQEATLVMSLSPMTLPHQMVRLFLAEQLYRAGTIMSGHPYHRS